MCEDSQRCTFGIDSQYVDLAAEVFTLLSDPTRIRIILALRKGELAVGELAEKVHKSPTAVSQHLAKLRWGKIVTTRQEGTHVFYSLVDEHARELVIQAVFQAEHVVGGVPPHHRNADGSFKTDGSSNPDASVEPDGRVSSDGVNAADSPVKNDYSNNADRSMSVDISAKPDGRSHPNSAAKTDASTDVPSSTVISDSGKTHALTAAEASPNTTATIPSKANGPIQ